eukprot:TRINITY_DN8151_c0_g1_i5.p1 TRINITY_DN8151_c0_g1~~TRINITY_DN8151_c0_g1_i5.p1  ORF type:complete len:727 (-),score=159.34 TRINITY_DN8151_c0_g1_i5:2802-4982(-)
METAVLTSVASTTTTLTISSKHQIKSPNHPSNAIFSNTHLFPSPLKLPTSTKFTTILCNSTKTPSPKPPSSDPSNPSLSDQLKPFSLTILPNRQNPPPPNLHNKPKSTWSNPTKRKPSVLSLQRHKRSPYSLNPHLQDLKLFSHKLNACEASATALSAALEELPHPPTRENALLILNSLRTWEKTHLFFNWLKTQNLFPLDTIFYNVTMKSLRNGRQYQLVDDLASEMIEQGIDLDNVTYSTIITCAKRCNLYDKAVEWFERMYKTGVLPDEVSYSAILDVYARLGKVGEVVSLYERARAGGWRPDPIAFAVLAKMFGEAGDYDGIQYVLQEMKSLGVEPNMVVYNTLLEAMGKAGKPGLARSLFEEMIEVGLSPNEKTLTALVKIYGKARWGKDALELWERMRSNKWPMDFILYNTLLSMCADLGLEQEAEKLFDDMKGSARCRPDSWSYTAMLNIYGSGGKVDRAMGLFEEMMRCGVKLNVMGCTCLIQCLGRAKQIDDVVRVFGVSMEKGVKPDDRLCCCLLSVLTFCEEDEIDKVLGCLEKANPKLVEFLKLLEKKEVSFDMVKENFRGILNDSVIEARRPFCNCLIDVCQSQNLYERAHELLYLGTLYGLYPGLHSKNDREWSLNVRSLSVGAAQTAFHEWMRTLSKAVERQEALPKLFSVHAGAGTHKFSQGLASSVALQLEKLSAPFQPNQEQPGCFIATQEDVISWVQTRVPSTAVTA